MSKESERLFTLAVSTADQLSRINADRFEAAENGDNELADKLETKVTELKEEEENYRKRAMEELKLDTEE
jgi:hypothetical protein